MDARRRQIVCRLGAALLLATLGSIGLAVLPAGPAGAAPRKLEKLEPGALDILRSPAKFVGSTRRHIVVRPGRVELLRGPALVASFSVATGGPRGLALPAVERVLSAAGQRGWIERVRPGVYLLRAALAQAPGSVLDVSAPAVRELRLLDDPEVYVSALGATGRYTGVTVTSWDEATGRPDPDPSAPRPFVVYGNDSRLEVVRSTFAFLGSDRASAYGINWHFATGKAIGSVFHHNFFGAYTYAARGVVFDRDVFRDNAVYGLDPHTASSGLVVTRSQAYRNRVHGIVFSIDVTRSVVRGNHVHHNGANGIVMDDGSDHNVISGNLVEANKADGIVLLGSSANRVEANTVRANRVGVRVNLRSTANRVVANQVSGNAVGVELYQGAHRTHLERNQVRDSADQGMVLEAAESLSRNDVVEGAPVGVEIRGVVRLERTSVRAAKQGVLVVERGIADLDGVTVRSGGTGVEVRPGALASVRQSRLEARRPLGGVAPRVQSGNTLVTPRPATSWIAAAGVVFIVLAVALHLLHRGRTQAADATGVRIPAVVVPLDPRQAGRRAPARRARRPAPPPSRLDRAQRARRRARRLVRTVAAAVLVLVALVCGTALALSRRPDDPVARVALRQDGDQLGWIELSAGDVDLTAVAKALARQGDGGYLTWEGHAWLLQRSLVVAKGARLRVEGTELRLRSDRGVAVGLEARGGALRFDDATVTSWNQVAGAPDNDARDGRAWVLANQGARMEVLRSRLRMLGYDAPGRYGVSWRERGTGGDVDASTFTGNFYGAYLHGVEPMRIRNSVVERSVRYGLDPHSGTRGLVVEGNVFRYNGKHGMILAVGCSRAVVRGNESHGNRGHGIVIFQGSDDALVRDNLVHHNGASGIDISGSARTRVTGNTVYANADGVSAHDRAVDVTVLGNRLTANRGDGLRLIGGTRTAVVQDNVIDHNFRAGAQVSGDGVVLGPRNQLTENETGVWLDDRLDGSTVIGNRIADNVLDGMHLVGESAAVVRGNTITGNRKAAFSVLAAGAAGGLVHGNTVGAHQALERVRAAETPGGLRKGAVGQALEDE